MASLLRISSPPVHHESRFCFNEQALGPSCLQYIKPSQTVAFERSLGDLRSFKGRMSSACRQCKLLLVKPLKAFQKISQLFRSSNEEPSTNEPSTSLSDQDTTSSNDSSTSSASSTDSSDFDFGSDFSLPSLGRMVAPEDDRDQSIRQQGPIRFSKPKPNMNSALGRSRDESFRLANTIQTLRRRSNAKLALSGHGGWHPGHGYVQIPQDTTLRFMTKPGVQINDSLGCLLDKGETEPLRNSNGQMYFFGPGQWVNNVQLTDIETDRICGDPYRVSEQTSLQTLLTKLQGFNLDWSACFSDATMRSNDRISCAFKANDEPGGKNSVYFSKVSGTLFKKSQKISKEVAEKLMNDFLEPPGLIIDDQITIVP